MRIMVGVVAGILRGFVVKALWGWFMVPLGVQGVSISHALGIGFLVSYMTKQMAEIENSDFAKVLTFEVAWAILTLAFGFAAHLLHGA
jgi:hypothetical protein